MNAYVKTNTLIWLPRLLTIIFILFISIFSLDALSSNEMLSQKLINFSIHLIPSFVLIATLIISWNRPLIGGLVFIILGIVFTLFFNTYKEFINFLIISFPLILTGILFLFSYYLLRNRKF